MSAPCERAAYEAGGWNDGRLGHAYNLIAEILAERGEEAREHPLLTQIDMLDEQCRPEAIPPTGDPHVN